MIHQKPFRDYSPGTHFPDGFFKTYKMTLLLITYNKDTDQLVALLSDELELKVAYCSTTNTVSVIKKDKVLTTAEVKPKFPASAFIDFCFNTAKYFGL